MNADRLEGFSLFDGMTRAELDECAAAFEVATVLMGERLTREDDFGYSFFVVLSGRVRVDVDASPVAELGMGDHFGEVSLVSGEKRNATVIALEACELAKIMSWDFKELMSEHPTLANRLQLVANERS